MPWVIAGIVGFAVIAIAKSMMSDSEASTAPGAARKYYASETASDGTTTIRDLGTVTATNGDAAAQQVAKQYFGGGKATWIAGNLTTLTGLYSVPAPGMAVGVASKYFTLE
jgi:hypothetical protein